MTEDEIGKQIVDAAVQLHQELGPGLLETVYEVILAHKLRHQGLQVERQVVIPVEYQGLRFDEGFRADLVVENKVIIELKCVEKLNNVHKKKLLTYLRLTEGYLLNFAEALMKNGVTRIVNRLEENKRSRRDAEHAKEMMNRIRRRYPRAAYVSATVRTVTDRNKTFDSDIANHALWAWSEREGFAG